MKIPRPCPSPRSSAMLALLFALAALHMAVPEAGGATYTIRADGTGDFPTIQEGIQASVAGDVVLLIDGVYRGAGNRDLHYDGKGITVRSLSGNPAQCIIDCEGQTRGARFYTAEPPEAVLQGVQIRNGQSTNGGGIAISGSSPTIRGCVFASNTADLGAAIYT